MVVGVAGPGIEVALMVAGVLAVSGKVVDVAMMVEVSVGGRFWSSNKERTYALSKDINRGKNFSKASARIKG